MSFALSLQEAMKVKTLVKKRGFESTSDYFRFLIAEDDVDLISEDELVRRLKSIPRLERAGKLLRAKSLRDLV